MTSLLPLRVERDGAVTILTLDRPDVLNAFDERLTEALNASLADCAADAAIRVVVITGSGRAFSTGQDLDDRLEVIERSGDLHLGDELRRRYHPAIAAIREMRKPVIAAVNGVAAGAGLGLAIACDIRVAASSASFRAASFTASSPLPQSRFTVTPGTVSGSPARSDAIRPTLRLSSPAWFDAPNTTSSISESPTSVRSSTARMTCEARSSGRIAESAPP